MAERSASSGLSHEHTVDMIEADILAAQAALERLGEDANASRSYTARQQQPAEGNASDVANAVNRRPASISETRRREILAKLASERVELRGFASDREARVVESLAENNQQRQPFQSLPQRNTSRGPEAVSRAVQDAAAAAVSSALDRAMASLSRGNVSSTGVFTTNSASASAAPSPQRSVPFSVPSSSTHPALPSTQPAREAEAEAGGSYRSPTRGVSVALQASQQAVGSMRPETGGATVGTPARHEQVITTAQQWEASSAAPPSVSSPGSSYSPRPYSSQSKEEKEKLIAQLLAERRAKVGSSSSSMGGDYLGQEGHGGWVGGSPARTQAASIAIPSMPPVPPVVAQLQAQAKLAAETAARAAEAAAQAAVQQTLVERTIAEQRRQLQEVSGQAQEVQEPLAASAGQPTATVASPPPRAPQSSSTAAPGSKLRSPRVKVTSPQAVTTSAAEVQVQPTGTGTGSGTSAPKASFKRPSKADVAAEREAKLYGECTFRPGQPRTSKGSAQQGASARAAGSHQPPSSSPGTAPKAHAARLAELARTKAEQWEVLQRKKLEEEEARMASECTFQPNASVDPSRGVLVGKDGKVIGTWPGKEREGSAGAESKRRSSRSRSPNGQIYQAEDLLSKPSARSVAPKQAPAASSQRGPTGEASSRSRRDAPPAPGAGDAFTAAARANALTQGPAPAPSPPRSYQRPFVPAGTAAQSATIPGNAASRAGRQGEASGVGEVQLESPLRWEKSKAKQYVDGPGFVVARAVREPAPQVLPPPVPLQAPQSTLSGTTKVAPQSLPMEAPEPTGTAAAVPAVAQRLFAEADARATKRARAKAALEQKAIAQYTFKPNLNPTSLALVNKSEEAMTAGQPSAPVEKQRSKPLHERSAALARAHEQYLHRLRVEANLANKDITFKPKLNPVSEHLASAQAVQKGLPSGSERLMAEAVELEARRQAARRAAAEAEAQAHPFVPKTLPASQRILEKKLQKLGLDDDAAAALSGDHSSGVAGVGGTGPGDAFLARQAVLSQLSKKRRASIVKEIEESDPCTFRPDIGNADEILALARPDRVTEGQEERIHRLAKEEAEAQTAARAKREQEYYSKFSYKPALNSNSLARARSKTVDERSKNEAGARIRLRAQAEADVQFQQAHPFQPTLIAREPHAPGRRGSKDSAGSGGPASVVSQGTGTGAGVGALRLAIRSDPEHVSERIKEYEKSKEAKLEAARKLAEYEAMQGCTFAPDTAASKKSHAKVVEAIATDGGVVVVRGLGRHLELRELSRKLEEEKREREAEAFAVKGVPSYDDLPPGQPKPPTVPEPFHLSTAETAPLIAARHAEREGRGQAGTSASAKEGVGRGNARTMLQELLDRDTTVFLAQTAAPQARQPAAAASKQPVQVPAHPSLGRPAQAGAGAGADVTQGINITRM